jgi:hypothetical protein
MSAKPTLKVDLDRSTRKVDTLEMKAEARRSMGVYGKPVTVTKDDEPAPWWAYWVYLPFAFTFGVLLAQPVRSPAPPLPAPRRFVVIPVTLYAAPFPAPRTSSPVAPARARRPDKPRPAPSSVSIKEPLFQ